jgi:hypothetical protein
VFFGSGYILGYRRATWVSGGGGYGNATSRLEVGFLILRVLPSAGAPFAPYADVMQDTTTLDHIGGAFWEVFKQRVTSAGRLPFELLNDDEICGHVVALVAVEFYGQSSKFEQHSAEQEFLWEVHGRVPMLGMRVSQAIVLEHPIKCSHRSGNISPSTPCFRLHPTSMAELLVAPCRDGGTVSENLQQWAEDIRGSEEPCWALQVFRPVAQLVHVSLWSDHDICANQQPPLLTDAHQMKTIADQLREWARIVIDGEHMLELNVISFCVRPMCYNLADDVFVDWLRASFVLP